MHIKDFSLTLVHVLRRLSCQPDMILHVKHEHHQFIVEHINQRLSQRQSIRCCAASRNASYLGFTFIYFFFWPFCDFCCGRGPALSTVLPSVRAVLDLRYCRTILSTDPISCLGSLQRSWSAVCLFFLALSRESKHTLDRTSYAA